MKPLIASTSLALLLLGACAPGQDTASERVDRPERPVGRNEVLVEATDYSFVGLPEEVEAGSTMRLLNTSDQEAHELVLFRLPDHERRSVAELFALRQTETIAALGGPPALVLLAGPSSEGVVDQGDATLREPGRYAVVCTVPTGADPRRFTYDAADFGGSTLMPGGGAPHFIHGMLGETTVV